MTGWKVKSGKRWGRKTAIRAARLFRSYVRTPSNPDGPIERKPCIFHPRVLGEWHHPDHRRPFFGVWLCGFAGLNCHRQHHRGLLPVPEEKFEDYLPVVRSRLRPALRGTRNGMHASKRRVKSKRTQRVPF